jgi:hypothetical protein
MKTIYIAGRFADPANPTADTKAHARALAERNGMQICNVIFPGDIFAKARENGYDLEAILERVEKVPQGELMILDIEHDDWRVFGVGDHSNILLANIEKRATLNRACREQRPDLQIGQYGTFPLAAMWAYGDSKSYGYTELVNEACIPLADASDVICPSWYCNSDTKLEDMLFAIEHVKKQCDKYYPGKRIVPFLMPWACDVLVSHQPQIWKPDFVWTPETIAKLNLLPKYWREMLKAMDHNGINEIILWTEGYYPLEEKMEWWQACVEWANK